MAENWSRRRFLGTALAALACGGRALQPGVAPPALDGDGYDGPRVTISFWNGFTGGDGSRMRALVAEFNATHPRIAVVMNAIRWEDYYRRIPVAAASGKGPDVGVVQQHRLVGSAARGVIVPLDALAARFGLVERDFFGPAWSAARIGGQRYGIPLDVHPLGMYCNARAFAEAGNRGAPPPRGQPHGGPLPPKGGGFRPPVLVSPPGPPPLHFRARPLPHRGGP